MVQVYFSLITVILCVSSVHLKKIVVETGIQGYYWRDLIDDLPAEAFPGGTDANGQVTYIGQAVHYGSTGSLLTGPYIPKDRKMFYDYGTKQWSVEKRIKILCSQEPEYFVWITVKAGESVERGQHLEYVRGGDDTERPLGIGRIIIGNQLIQGKTLIVNGVFEKLYYNWNSAVTATTQYEALFYNKYKGDGCSQKSPITISVY